MEPMVEQLKGPYIAPRLTLRVGVTGHRPHKLEGVDTSKLHARASEVLHYLSSVTRSLQEKNDALGGAAPFSPESPDLRLATSIAEGADQIVTDAAVDAGYNLNLILPFPRASYAQDFEGAALEKFQRTFDHNAVQSCTELDLGDMPDGRNDGYLAAGHLMLAHSDVLVAIWDQKAADGLGGSAEIVNDARQRGIITVLITLEGELKLWKVPDTAVDLLEDGEWQALNLSSEATPVSLALAEQIEEHLALPEQVYSAHDTPSFAAGLRRFKGEKFHPHCWAFGYNLLRWAFLPERRFSLQVDNGLTRECQQAWIETHQAAENIGGATFRNHLDLHLRARWLGADNLAIHYSHLFRSAYIANFTIAAVAVLVGLLAVFFWESKAAKAICVLVELIIIGTILMTTWLGHRGQWRDRWLDYRSLAEALRPARLPLLMGSSPIRPSNNIGGTPTETWIAWYVRASLRGITPPTAVIDQCALQAAIDVTLSEEIDSQLSYHRENARLLHLLDHRLERAAEVALWATIASGTVYLLAFALYMQGWQLAADFYKPLATLLGATLPVVGAAIFGIRATGDFRSSAQQSLRMVSELEQLARSLKARRGSPDRQSVRRLLGQVSLTLSDDLRIWRLIYSERELTPGF